MKHPFQKVLLNEKGDLLFAGAGQKLFVFQRRGNWELADSWVDTVDPNYALIKEYEARSRKFEQESAAGDCKPPKVPTPGPGAPPKLCYIRDIRLSRSEKYLILTTDTDKAVVVFELNGGGSLREIKRQPLPKRPCAVSTSLDDSTVVVGDKFGDVYCIDMLSSEVKDEKDMVPVLGHVSMLTGVLNVSDEAGNELVVTTDRDEHIRLSRFPQSYIIEKWLFEHEEFVASIVAPRWCRDKVLVSGGGDPFLCSWRWQEGVLADKLDLSAAVAPYLTEEHLVPSRFQNDAGDLKEFTVSQLLELPSQNRLVVLFDKMSAFLVVSVAEDGKLSLERAVAVASPVICGTASAQSLVLSVRGTENCLLEYALDSWTAVELREVYGRNDVEWDEKGDLFASFSVNQLRKRSEH
ncbi:hypothetical protein KL944_001062 [Ogataea haglerorum]|nr:hypothetical protein KL944_001062 [Ogataea haglerorum]